MAAKTISSPKTKKALAFWQGVNNAALAKMPVDLSSRQTAVLLHVYMQDEPHSIKSLSEALAISKPAICRAIDMLEKARLVKRSPDRRDRRNVIIGRTVKGTGYLGEFAAIIVSASKKIA